MKEGHKEGRKEEELKDERNEERKQEGKENKTNEEWKEANYSMYKLFCFFSLVTTIIDNPSVLCGWVDCCCCGNCCCPGC